LYYASYIEDWYKEWFLEIKKHKIKKYKKKIEKLETAYQSFMKLLKDCNQN